MKTIKLKNVYLTTAPFKKLKLHCLKFEFLSQRNSFHASALFSIVQSGSGLVSKCAWHTAIYTWKFVISLLGSTSKRTEKYNVTDTQWLFILSQWYAAVIRPASKNKILCFHENIYLFRCTILYSGIYVHINLSPGGLLGAYVAQVLYISSSAVLSTAFNRSIAWQDSEYSNARTQKTTRPIAVKTKGRSCHNTSEKFCEMRK